MGTHIHLRSPGEGGRGVDLPPPPLSLREKIVLACLVITLLMLSARNLRVSERRIFACPRKYGQFSEARSSALGSPIFNWSKRVGPSVHGPNTFFDKPPCETSVRAKNTQKPDNDFANRAAGCCGGPWAGCPGGCPCVRLGPGLSWAEGLL